MNSALWEWRQEGCEFKGCLGYTVKPFREKGKQKRKGRRVREC